MYRVVLDSEALPLSWRQCQVAEVTAPNIHDLVARPAHQVIMPLNLSIESSACSRMVQTPNHAKTDERFQDTVHGGARKPGNLILQRFVYLVGCWMVVVLQDYSEDLSSLDCQRQPPLAAKVLELADSLCDLVLF